MSAKVVLLSPGSGERVEEFRRLAPEGVEIGWVDSSLPIDEQAEQMRDTVAVIAIPSVFPVELARACPNVRLVQTVSAGTNMMDLQALGELGVKVANNGGGNAVAVAEHTITLMVSVYRKLQLQLRYVRERKWAGDIRENWFEDAYELTGKTVGIIGLGRIGQRVARRLQGWECDLLYSDVVTYPAELECELNVRRVDRDELLRESDIVTLHVPLNRHTRAMLSDREFDLMRPNAVLINACRGPVVDEAALIRAMQEGKISGAGLDVLEEEPTSPDNPLLDMDRVLVTPHLAGFGQEASAKSRAFAVRNTTGVAAGAEPESVVLPE